MTNNLLSPQQIPTISDSVAIIGMGCRFPGSANNPESFWEILRTGKDCITEVPENRFNHDEYYSANPDSPGKMVTKWGSYIDGFDTLTLFFLAYHQGRQSVLIPSSESAWK